MGAFEANDNQSCKAMDSANRPHMGVSKLSARCTMVLAGLPLLVAGLFKAHQIYADPSARDPLLGTRFILVLAAEVELMQSILLVAGCFQRLSIIAARVWFVGLFGLVQIGANKGNTFGPPAGSQLWRISVAHNGLRRRLWPARV